MSVITKPGIFLAAAAVAFGLAGSPPVGPSSEQGMPGSWAALQEVRQVELGDFDVANATDVAWSESLGVLVVVHGAGKRLTALTPDEYPAGRLQLPKDLGAEHVAVDPASGSITVLGGTRALVLDGSAMGTGPSVASMRTDPGALPDVEGVIYDARAQLVLLDEGDLVRPHATEAVRRTRVTVPDGHELRGLALHPHTGELLTLDTTARHLLALDADGTVTAVHDASAVDLLDPRGLAVAPSADTTDHPSVQSIYVADAGAPGAAGTLVETRLAPVGLAASYTVASSQVRTVDTSAYDPPSPDPSGVAYLPGAARLFITDGEVNEMKNLFEGSNFFATNLLGEVQDLGVSQPWSNEPVGVGYNPTNNHLFVSDDDQKEVFEVVAGDDGRFGTRDDTVTHFDTAGFGNTDPEGVDYDPASNSIWLVDGVNAEVFRVRPGGDGRFGSSDDVRAHFDVGKYGARDPEGLGYDSARDTIVIVDDSSDTIYELDKGGALLNTIDTSAANMRAAAGLAIGPSTSGGGRSYYVVARGLDNDSNPDENDGRLYEISSPLSGGGGTNQAPAVDAGPELSIVLPDTALLDGTVTDDGLPDPPGAVTTTWSMASGPGTVTFGDPSSVDTTASFSTDGTYVLRLTADDGAATSIDDVAVSVSPEGGAQITERRVATSSDDAEQALSGFTALTSSDLELTTDGSTEQVVGVRFADLQLPQGATITKAYVQFRTDEVSTGASSMTIRAEAADNTPTYQKVSGNVTSRATTAQSVPWSPPDWTTVGAVGAAERTPDVAALVQAVVDRAGWASGNALALQFSGTGRRAAEAYEGGASFAPLLHVEYATGDSGGDDGGGGGVVNRAPVVDAGSDVSVVLPESASLDGTVTDDGLPDPPGAVTTGWALVSGAGTVTFGDPGSVDTTASFSEAGSYVLGLTADDGEVVVSDEVTVTVTASDDGGGAGGGGGTAETVELRVAAGSDDAEQSLKSSANTYLTSDDLEIAVDGNTPQLIGVRFADLRLPPGATITKAYVQFRVDGVTTGDASLTVRAEAADDTPTYQAVAGDVSSRETTSQSVGWVPDPWSTVGEEGPAQRTPDLAVLVQAVVDRAGWASGNALAFQIEGTGTRKAVSYEGGASRAPLLHVEYTVA
jgi:hypothetical protein